MPRKSYFYLSFSIKQFNSGKNT